MTGSDRHFEGGEARALKGVEDPWRVYRLVPETLDGEAVASRRPSMVPLYTRRQRRRLVAGLAGVLVVVARRVGRLRADPARGRGGGRGERGRGDRARRRPAGQRRRRGRAAADRGGGGVRQRVGDQLDGRLGVADRPGAATCRSRSPVGCLAVRGGGRGRRGVGRELRGLRPCPGSTRRPRGSRRSRSGPGRPGSWWRSGRCGSPTPWTPRSPRSTRTPTRSCTWCRSGPARPGSPPAPATCG